MWLLPRINNLKLQICVVYSIPHLIVKSKQFHAGIHLCAKNHHEEKQKLQKPSGRKEKVTRFPVNVIHLEIWKQ